MTALLRQFGQFSQWLRSTSRRTTQGFFEITQSGFTLIGLAVIFGAITLAFHPEIRQSGERALGNWLQSRQAVATLEDTGMDAYLDVRLDAIDRATATDPASLPKQQAALTYWLSKKYRVAPEPVAALVAEAFSLSGRTKLEPTLILAVMAIESGFNPFAQSHVGAQGLMQVMTRVHSDKYESFGGKLAAFDPVTNLRVGVRVLQECIARAGSLEAGLRFYVGAANLDDDGGYAAKVLAEHSRMKQVSAGRVVPLTASQVVTITAPKAPANVKPTMAEKSDALTDS
jgi:Transglycosylase SLT domain